jgi:hypothetical protein
MKTSDTAALDALRVISEPEAVELIGISTATFSRLRMANGIPSAGDVPSGATMRPQYMGRVMNTYLVSEPEMENISSLSAQSTARFSISTLLLGLAASVWINAIFYSELTPDAKVACYYVAPLLLVFSAVFVIGGIWAQHKRRNAWQRIKDESIPLQAVTPARDLIAPQAVS